MVKNICWICMLLLACAPLVAMAATKNKSLAEGDSGKPIEIDADTLTINQNKTKAIFDSNVVAVQGGMKMTSDQMVVFYNSAEQRKQTGKSFSKIEALGHVVLHSANRIAKADKAIYNAATDQIELTGNVTMIENNNTITGEKFVYNTRTGTSRIMGVPESATAGTIAGQSSGAPKQRARVVLVPEDTVAPQPDVQSDTPKRVQVPFTPEATSPTAPNVIKPATPAKPVAPAAPPLPRSMQPKPDVGASLSPSGTSPMIATMHPPIPILKPEVPTAYLEQ